MEKEVKNLLLDSLSTIDDCYGSFNNKLDICLTLCGDSDNCKVESLKRSKKPPSSSSALTSKAVLKVIEDTPGIKLKQLLTTFKKGSTLSEDDLRTEIINILSKKVDIDDTGSIYLKNKN